MTLSAAAVGSVGAVGRGASMAAGMAGGALGSYKAFGLSMRFSVKAAQVNLGEWSSCKGLKVEFKTEEIREGGNSTVAAILPVEVSYGQITLERAMEAKDSIKVQNWLKDVVRNWMDGARGAAYQGTTVTIVLMDYKGRPVADWSLRHAIPVSWTGPSLSAKDNNVALETLQLAHFGFL